MPSVGSRPRTTVTVAHDLDAVVATQALELGIDVGSLDVSLVTGFPGTVTSLRQRWGRAGRSGHGYAVLVAGQDALDQYFMREPDRLLGRSVEEAIIDLHNPHISGPHLEAAAYERPLTADDQAYFGEQGLLQADRLAQSGRLRRRKDGLVWSRPYSPAAGVGLRTASNEQFAIVEGRQGEVIGTVERERVFRFCHPGAVYLHRGRSYLVQHLDLETRTVMVDDFEGSYYTQTKTDKNVLIAGQADSRELPGAVLFAGDLLWIGLFPNVREAEALLDVSISGVGDALEAARTMVASGVQVAIITLAEEGLVYATSEGHGRIPAIRCDVVDWTGAGDALSAAVAYGLINGMPVDECMRLGVAAATLTLKSPESVNPAMSLEQLYANMVI